MTSNSSPGRWHILAGLLALSLISVGAVGVDTVSPDGPSFRSIESTTSVSADTQHIALKEGWNLISSRLVPDDPSMDAVFAPVAGAVEVVRGPSGAVYRPSGGTNAIGDWDVHESYEVYTTSPQTLVIEGSPPVPSESGIPLQEGWNAISYLPPTTKPLTEAFASIDGALVMAKDETGDAFVPGEGITQLESLTPGEGYKIHVASSTTLEYPLDEETLFTYDAQCESQSDAYLAHEHGDLTEGSLDISVNADSLKIIENTNTINTAIDAAGQEGGTVCLPKGRYELASPHLTDPDPPGRVAALFVDHDNITLWGAGRNDNGGGTGLYTNGKYYVVDGSVRRGHGLSVENGNSNIFLRDFELNGQGALPGDSTAWTGNKNYPADPETGDGWDTSHKGLIVGWGAGKVTNLLVERVAIRSYKGEMIYQGGISLEDATFRDIISEDTNAQTFNVHGINVLVEDSYFGLSNQFWEIEALWGDSGHSGEYRNNVFEGNGGGVGIAIAQGDNTTVPFDFYGNTFKNCDITSESSGYVLDIAEATGGPVNFYDNDLEDCALFRGIKGGGNNTGPKANVFLKNNTIEGLRNTPAINPAYGGFKNLIIEGNTFEHKEGHVGSMMRVRASVDSGVVKNNTFVKVGGVDVRDFPSELPVFRNNEYISGGGFTNWLDNPGDKIRIVSGRTSVANPDDYGEAFLVTEPYRDGFQTSIKLKHDWREPIVFTTDNDTYDFDEERVLEPGKRFLLEFDGDIKQWTFTKEVVD